MNISTTLKFYAFLYMNINRVRGGKISKLGLNMLNEQRYTIRNTVNITKCSFRSVNLILPPYQFVCIVIWMSNKTEN